MKIRAIVEVFNSKCDYVGNCYWAFRYIDTETGRTVFGTIPNRANVECAIRFSLGIPTQSQSVSYQELGVREFNRLVKDWPYAGCTPTEIAEFIRKGVGLGTS